MNKLKKMPPMLHDIFGERQSIAVIVAILSFGGLLTGAIYVAFPAMTDRLPLWRSILAFILIFDILCGCVANFTASTNNYYATRKTHRIVFISIHVHIVLIALLLSTNELYALGVWAYTIFGAVLVNALHGKASQLLIGGFLLCGGLVIIPMLPGMAAYMNIVSSLFMLKVLFSFAVDHYRGTE